ncbi:hypothetical protein E9531_13495 [Lampropedia puyangensis]|uniref:Uncharacterized protein n=1 Tax=Lampropedia puyangensis TaxID=1330072 RepID=A0A4S8EWB1_9BURK|nr:hypothetical protein [Lampropedia puyangensis]THT98806.1 hypothetical protein E9531_13495 [Lampropedia puyangensis]
MVDPKAFNSALTLRSSGLLRSRLAQTLGVMTDIAILLNDFASEVAPICSHVSVRNDENGPYVFALGLKGMHTLQLRMSGGNFVVQLWLGATAEDESIIEEPKFSDASRAFRAAKEWLEKDVV